jgi:hypothetical protein
MQNYDVLIIMMITIYKILQASKTPIIHQHITSQPGSQPASQVLWLLTISNRDK